MFSAPGGRILFKTSAIKICLLESVYKSTRNICERLIARISSFWWDELCIGFDSRRGLGIFLFTTASRTALEPIQRPFQWVPGLLSLGVKRPGPEADLSRPSTAGVKEWVKLYLHAPNTLSWCGAQLKSAQG